MSLALALDFALNFAPYVALYLLAAFPAWFLGQRLLVDAYWRVVSFDLDVIDPPKVIPLADGAGIMIDYSAQKYSMVASFDIEEVREQLLDQFLDVMEPVALYTWPSVRALYATGRFTIENCDPEKEWRKDRREVLMMIAHRAPVWPIGLGGMLMMYVGARGFVRVVERGEF